MLWKFIKHCTLLSLPILIGLLLYCWKYQAFFPDPKYTNNLSLNMKLQQGLSNDDSLDIISIGSSMNLNNLSSEAVTEQWPGARYYNFGFWGCDMSSILTLLPLIVEKKQPSRVVITTNLMDFEGNVGDIKLDTASIRSTLECESDVMRYLSNWNAPFYLRNMESNRIRFSDNGNYEYMGMDPNGGSKLEVTHDRISEERFNALPTSAEKLNDLQYLKFDSIASYLNTNGIELIVLQSPYREGILDSTSMKTVGAHVERLQQILRPYKHKLLDGTDRLWRDELYGDSSHLNGKGAFELSQYCFGKF